MIWGHAQYAEYGMDIVCAGVSAVATAALMGLIRSIPGKVHYQILKEGTIYCRLAHGLSVAEARDAQVILGTMVLGFLGIWVNYRRNIDIAYRR